MKPGQWPCSLLWMREAGTLSDPERFLDYKWGVSSPCWIAFRYDPMKEGDFRPCPLFYRNALECRRQEEAGSFFQFSDEYKVARIAWFHNNSARVQKMSVAEYANHQNCTEMILLQKVPECWHGATRAGCPHQTVQDEEGEETGVSMCASETF